ncbi:Exodeoxyribonuclease 7 large subunit [Mucisphaera calidilacus]|uniref:Exodeoxyribonuclease 7 large subunit n=2 Tax=Mucisphaera calidilacus TaxID=2527982 RepID=A0A518BWG6_9BACT|nr:Exodeoxyribonuclease 7 large subunit [Mucisphaera calidilacus]
MGEVGNLSVRTHWYFSLKDADATLRCACFANRTRSVKFRPENGMSVVATGRLDYYPPSGSLSLIVDRMELAGEGALEAELRRRVAELRELGYFDPERKQTLPAFPSRIAVVTSGAGAALQDVIDTTRRRWPGCELLLADVSVQGAKAEAEVSRAIRALSASGPEMGIDAVILTRGGGSMEDLWAFNERSIADAIFECRLPVVAAIGHEVDTTIAELVADERAATPTQAAMRLVPDREALRQQVDQTARRLAIQAERLVESGRRRLERVESTGLFRQPRRWLNERGEQLDRLVARLGLAVRAGARPHRDRLARLAGELERAASRRVEGSRGEVERLLPRLEREAEQSVMRAADRFYGLARQLEAVGPQQVLSRGYTYTLTGDGKLVRRAAEARAETRLRTVFADGEVRSVVENAPKRAAKTKARNGDEGLFGSVTEDR